MDTIDTLTTVLTLALAIPLIGLVALFLELHAQAQPHYSWWHDCRRTMYRVGRVSTAVSVVVFSVGALLLWGRA